MRIERKLLMYRSKTELFFSEPLIDYLANRGWIPMESEPDIAILLNLEAIF
jgi:hypothetical protein